MMKVLKAVFKLRAICLMATICLKIAPHSLIIVNDSKK